MSLYQGITADNMAELIKFRRIQHTLSIELMNKIKQWNTDMTTILEQYHLTVMEGQKPYHIVDDVIVRKTVEVCLDISGDKYNNAITAEQDQELVKVLDEHQLMIKVVQVNKPTIDGNCLASTGVSCDFSYNPHGLMCLNFKSSNVKISHEIDNKRDQSVFIFLTVPPSIKIEHIRAYRYSNNENFPLWSVHYAVNKPSLIKLILTLLFSNISLIYCETLKFSDFLDVNVLRNAEYKYNYVENKELIPFITQTGLTTITGLNIKIFPGLKEFLPHMDIS